MIVARIDRKLFRNTKYYFNLFLTYGKIYFGLRNGNFRKILAILVIS